MCRRVTCRTCKKPTWAGCGAHVEQVLGNVAVADRCSCRSGGATATAAPAKSARAFKSAKTVQPFKSGAVGATGGTAAAVGDEPAPRRSLLARLRGR